jgi:ribosomal protein S18 acetylase RimI-like enzyme
MVAARTALPRTTTFTGVRPMDVTRDLAGVAEVLAESFRGEMDAAGERAVREMRVVGRLGPFAGWLDLFMPVSEGFSPGFVWVEQGRVVGNATIRRAPASGWGHVIGNVAVLPEYRGRGIARHLMEACLDKARGDNSQWAALEVREDNAPAFHLYTSLGFKQTGAAAQLRREAIGPIVDKADLPFGVRVRRPHVSEQGQVYALAHSATPEGLRWAEPLRESEFVFGWERRFDLWMAGRRESWWVVESGSRLVGVAEAETYHHPSEEGRLRMWVAGSSDCHHLLLDAALSKRDVASRPMLVVHPAADADALSTFGRYGFRPVRTLAHMKLNLR